jgi:microcystin degradation protein MlrC
MRAFTATLATETNTFAPLPTGLSAFHAPWHYF